MYKNKNLNGFSYWVMACFDFSAQITNVTLKVKARDIQYFFLLITNPMKRQNLHFSVPQTSLVVIDC